jgi:hypothetical protein
VADNTDLDAGAGGDKIVTREISHGGDTAKLQGQFLMGISGTEGAYTAGAVGGDATNGLDVDVTRSALPTGASTSAKQPALGTAGTASTDVITVQGIASMTPILATLQASTNTQEVVGDAAHDAAAAGNPLLMGAYASAAAPTDVSADADAVRLWALRNGSLVVNIAAAGALIGATSNALDVNIKSSATLTVGSHAVTNAGTFVVQIDGNALTALQLIDDPVVADDAAFTAASTKVMMAGFVADEASTDPVNEDDGGAARMTLDRKLITTPYVHAAAGGHTPYKNLDCDETEDAIKASAGKLFWIHCINLSNAKRYLKIYNDTTANVSVGTTVPDLTFPIPTMADTNGAGFTIHFGDAGCQFSAAITVAATTGFADNDTGAPGANEVIFNAGYL